MKKLNQILREGVYDPGIFKAFFLAGGPGSGKTFVTQSAFAGTGLKVVNSDAVFERGLKKAGLSLKMPDEEEYFRNIIRAKAKMTTATALDTYIQGRLGLVIDATGRDINVINNQKSMLDLVGYDSYMIFVNTSLQVALERNRTRTRSVPEAITRKSWQTVQNNIGKFQNLFGRSNMIVVDNNNAKENELLNVYKEVRRLINVPVQNYVAKKWIENELRLKRQNAR